MDQKSKATKASLIERLTELSEQDSELLMSNVAAVILTLADDDPVEFFLDVMADGTRNGLFNNLSYGTDTAEFFDFYYDDIETLRLKHEHKTGQPVVISGDLKDSLTWFAFKAATLEVADSFDWSDYQ